MNYHIAVLDIGKTNKKTIIYDENLKIIDSSFQAFPEIIGQDGFTSDDLNGIFTWFLAELARFTQPYNIKAISITTHGATFACIDESGELTVPEISYTTDPGDQLHDQFYQEVGDPIELQKETATPNFMALINVAKGIFFIKNKYPEQFAKTKYILNLPQYFGYLLTHKAAAEPTYVGCHSYLWDFQRDDWSSVTEKLGIRDKLPPKISNTWDVLGKLTPEISSQTGLPQDTIVTLGIHDSNASLLPYSISMPDEFVLNSTGTWCVVMHEKDQVAFEKEELGKVVFYNLNVFNQPVKTAIFLGGLEFEKYTTLLKKINSREDFPAFDLKLYQNIISQKTDFILPGVQKGTGQFPDSDPRVVNGDKVYHLQDIEDGKSIPDFFRNYEYAYAVLNLSLAIQTKVAIDRVGISKGIPIYTEGGFRKNESYNKLLTALYPDSTISITNLKEATSFGAALIAKAALEQKSPIESKEMVHITQDKIEKVSLGEMKLYYQAFMDNL